jgi:hypothetical protein
MIRFEGRAKEATITPNKPISTKFKVWAIAKRGFLLCWNFHTPGQANGPLGVHISS